MADARPNIIQVTPFLGVRDLKASLDFYTGILEFGAYAVGGGYAYLERERAAIRLLEVGADEVPTIHLLSCYFDVHDVEAEFARLAERLATLPADRWRGPVDQKYGQRELTVRDPDGHLVIFGQGIGPNADQWDYRFQAGSAQGS
ncbi:MAG: bleomycin resistance protein [Sphingosinicella sp.]|uniref:bleomycin resistance protein n=1 Tax=Sphingosinicella sp. TaxID=1917971 RepID=UPI004037F320